MGVRGGADVVMVVAMAIRAGRLCRRWARRPRRKEMAMHACMRVRVHTPSMTMDSRRPDHGLSLAASAV